MTWSVEHRALGSSSELQMLFFTALDLLKPVYVLLIWNLTKWQQCYMLNFDFGIKLVCRAASPLIQQLPNKYWFPFPSFICSIFQNQSQSLSHEWKQHFFWNCCCLIDFSPFEAGKHFSQKKINGWVKVLWRQWCSYTGFMVSVGNLLCCK